jgi:hypothetical protein
MVCIILDRPFHRPANRSSGEDLDMKKLRDSFKILTISYIALVLGVTMPPTASTADDWRTVDMPEIGDIAKRYISDNFPKLEYYRNYNATVIDVGGQNWIVVFQPPGEVVTGGPEIQIDKMSRKVAGMTWGQ